MIKITENEQILIWTRSTWVILCFGRMYSKELDKTQKYEFEKLHLLGLNSLILIVHRLLIEITKAYWLKNKHFTHT